jgi:HipA-like protein
MATSEPLSAVQHIRKMRGGSQSHLLRASDGNFYVLKFQNNPQDIRILANEYLGSKIGALLGLPMPEVRLIDVSEWLINNTPDLKIETAGVSVPCASGLQLGIQYVADPQQARVFDYLPESMLQKLSNTEDFPRVLVFDKWTGNSDGRQAVFVRGPGQRLYRAVFIDQGYCFNAGQWDFPDSPLRGTHAQTSVYASVKGWKSFEPTLSRAEQIQLPELSTIAAEIPGEWYGNDTKALSRLIESLHNRRSLIRRLISDFRNSSRSPFPNWVGL